MADCTNVVPLNQDESNQVSGGIWKKNGVIPGYHSPTVLYDDGINVQTSDPSTTNVTYTLT